MKNENHVNITYGRGSIPLYTDPESAHWEVLRPRFEVPLTDAETAFRDSCCNPTGCPPLKEIVKQGDRVVIITSDGTRPVPNRKLIPWILKELPVPTDNISILLGNGTHRANAPEEILDMFGKDIAGTVQILNHDAYDQDRNEHIGKTASSADVYLDKVYVEADKRIVVGFIEPHFFAGFSGGRKGVIPGVAGIETIAHIHRAELIADPMSTWGVREENPIQREIANMVRLCPPDFMVNVTLNSDKEITGIFTGHYEEAHAQACTRVKDNSMVPVDQPFPVVITSNSGYPLDQNLYQTVKGISAAARIVEAGGTIIMASECSDGIPAHGNFAEIMQKGDSAEDILAWIFRQKETVLDQWQAQVLAEILKRTEVAVFSSLDRQSIEACKMIFVDDLQSEVEKRIAAVGKGARVAVLPDGPLTIPYVKGCL